MKVANAIKKTKQPVCTYPDGSSTQVRNIARPRLVRNTSSFSRLSDEDGGSLVEFALVLPMMMMVMLGIVVVGSTMGNYLQLIEANTSAARAIAVSRSNTLDPCNKFASAVIQGAPMLKSADMTFTLDLKTKLGAELNTYGPTKGSLTCSSGNYTSGAPSYLQEGGSAIMTVTYPCQILVYGKDYASGCTLQAQVTEVIQ